MSEREDVPLSEESAALLFGLECVTKDTWAENIRRHVAKLEMERDEARRAAGRLVFRYASGCDGDAWREEYEWLADEMWKAREDWYARHRTLDELSAQAQDLEMGY